MSTTEPEGLPQNSSGTDGAWRRGRWTALELALLVELLPERSLEDISVRLRRPVETVRAAIRRVCERPMDASAPRETLLDEELERLQRVLLLHSDDDAPWVVGRTHASIRSILNELRRQRRGEPFSAPEQRLLRERYGRHADFDLARVLGRDADEIAVEAARLCLGKDRRTELPRPARMPRWTEEEVELLRREFSIRATREIARQLGRTTQSVSSKAKQLGLRKSVDRLRSAGRGAAVTRHRGSTDAGGPAD